MIRTKFYIPAVLAGCIVTGPASAANVDIEVARRIMVEAIGDTSSFKIPDRMVRTMFRSAIEQHAGKALLMSRGPSEFEKMYATLRDEKIELPDGDSAAVAYLHGSAQHLQAIIAPDSFFSEWKKGYPNSPVPHLLYASARLSIFAEGHRYGAALPADQRKPINKPEIEATRTYLVLNKHTSAKSAYWYNLMVEIAILQEAGGDEVKRLVKEGLEAFPDSVDLARMASAYFLPNLHGDANVFDEYAVWVSDLPAMKERKDIYAQIYAFATMSHYKLTLFKFAKKNWGRMRPSLKQLAERYPGEENSNLAGLIACMGGDRELTRAIIAKPGFEHSDFYWLDKDAFGLCYNWATGG